MSLDPPGLASSEVLYNIWPLYKKNITNVVCGPCHASGSCLLNIRWKTLDKKYFWFVCNFTGLKRSGSMTALDYTILYHHLIYTVIDHIWSYKKLCKIKGAFLIDQFWKQNCVFRFGFVLLYVNGMAMKTIPVSISISFSGESFETRRKNWFTCTYTLYGISYFAAVCLTSHFSIHPKGCI